MRALALRHAARASRQWGRSGRSVGPGGHRGLRGHGCGLRPGARHVREAPRRWRPGGARELRVALDRRWIAADPPVARRRSPVERPLARRHRRRASDPRLLDRLHEGRSGLREVLRVPEPLRVRDADADPVVEPARTLRGLGRRRAVLLPPDRFLVREGLAGRSRTEGLRREPHRRRLLPDRKLPAGARLRDARPLRSGRQRPHPARGPLRRGAAGYPAPVRRCLRQVRAVPAVHLAAGRHGRAHARLGPDPRGDDGNRRRLPHRPSEPAVRGQPHDPRRHREWSAP